MLYTDFKGEKISKLGFGTMRMPQVKAADGSDVEDIAHIERMVDIAIKGGVNYFDTAWPYHDGRSETIIGDALRKYPRNTWFLADKYPGHQQFEEYHPEEIFEEQLRKCGVDYFDFYLMHNVCENSIGVYLDPRWALLDYFLEQKKSGRIRHLGFSCHGEVDCLRRFLDSPWGKHMEFCQIQLNYVDWELQHAKEKVQLLGERGIPVWVMEPQRGGLLSKHSAELAFRWLMEIPGVATVLSGMSSEEQMRQNIDTFSSFRLLTSDERRSIEEYSDTVFSRVPCTACRYCTEGCPQHLDIPALINACNQLRIPGMAFTPVMFLESLKAEQMPDACIGCGNCTHICPQHIDIPSVMEELADRYSKSVKWSDICRERNKIAKEQKAK